MEGRVKRAVFDRGQRSARVALIVLASLTLSLLPLRALCELVRADATQATGEHQTGHEGTSDLCCTSIDEGALVDSVAPDLSAGPTAPLVVLLFSGLILSRFAARPSQLAGAPPPSRSYYARSSRILR